MISAKVIADSLAPSGKRITTLSLIYPRFIHSELMTHRALSRNAASSRAIPVKKQIESVRNNPAMPVFWGKNQPGMQAREELSDVVPEDPDFDLGAAWADPEGNNARFPVSPRQNAKDLWVQASYMPISYVESMVNLGLHKQIANRILEPWVHISTLVTATEWDNFFNLRAHPDAQPEFQALAEEMLNVMNDWQPLELSQGDWHLPYVTEDEREYFAGKDELMRLSAARCARVSYNNHDTNAPPDPEKDIARAADLLSSGHLSPFEHQATPALSADACDGNFRGWLQYRKMLPSPFEGPSKRLKKKYRLTPEEKLWMSILERSEDLKGTADEVKQILQDRSFSQNFINAYLSKHHER